MSRIHKIIFLFLFVSLSASVLFGQKQPPQPEVYKILGISVEGQRSGEPSAIIANTGLKVGGEITIPSEQTKLAIQRLHNLRIFDDVQIFIENRVEDGVYLLIKVKENPRLERIEVTGNDELDQDDILKKITLVKGQIVTQLDISASVRAIKHQYDTDGYLNAHISTTLVTVNDTTGRVALKVVVDEGPKVKVDYIHFHGLKVYDDGDL